MKRQTRATIIAVVLGFAGCAPFSPATANDTIDTTTTGSIPSGEATPTAESQGTQAFRDALAVLNEGKAQEAFTLAATLDNPIERHTIQWAAMYYHRGDIDYRLIKKFRTEAPSFASDEVFSTRIEQSLIVSEPSASDAVKVFGANGLPRTVDGQILLAKAYVSIGAIDAATRTTRSLWVDNFLTEKQEASVFDGLSELIDGDTHWRRAQRLMMHDRARASERMIPYLTEAQGALVVARAAVSRKEDDGQAALDRVDVSLQSNAAYVFSRAQIARQNKTWQSAADWMAKAPADLIDADEWWYERRTLLRQLLDAGEAQLAYEVADGYQQGSEGRLVEARFHAGWIALSFLSDAAIAREHFAKMAALSTLPDSVTQANYWLGRANLRLDDVEAARSAFQTAAQYSTVYYGQLARVELGEPAVLIRPLPQQQASETLFESNQVVRAVRLLAANGQGKLAVPLLRHYSNGLKGDELMLAAKLAEEIHAPQLAISIAGIADQQGTPLDEFSFPTPLTGTVEQVADLAAVHAITRQESMFQVDAVSSAGARGLMQLMPGTAKDVAQKVGVDYSPARLVTDGAYNALLGSTYLDTQLNRYGGSLVLAAAAYNAGPGNADKWIRAYGDPREENVDPVIWVELIPFQETRTYVKRVLGNYLVYRERLGDAPVTLQQALRTIR